ncbi:MFS transporter [Marinoscillum sp. MHG1-6]|uniref:MFS transporter n=1 Tax=Marinoscillum sp. MHG1-6 TaxID=2959627 RepID=UPI0021571230|nr:MFS transporter [Marinoscillum sp. MHG1-6]
MDNSLALDYESNSKLKYVSKEQVLWKQLLSLTLLYASVIIGWIAYYNYQPILLEKYSFKDLTLFLFISQGIIMVLTPPIAGMMGDKFRRKAGQRLPIISAGVSFAAMIFMATAFTLFTDPGPVFRWILPGLIVLWLFSMALFTSPAISTIEVFVPVNRLPTAMALLTVVYGLLYAIEPVIVDLINFLGAPLTFVVGGVAVLGSGLLMRSNSRYMLDVPPKQEVGKSDFTYAFALGACFGIVTTILFNLFPDWFTNKNFSVMGISGSGIISAVLAVVALVGYPIGRLAEKRSVYLSILISILGVTALTVMIYFTSNPVLLTIELILFAVTYALMSVTFLPLALTVVKDKNKVLGVGIFFAGFELPNGVLEAILVKMGLF